MNLKKYNFENLVEKLLGVKIDFKLSFDKKASNKLRALGRVSHYNSFFDSQSNYCPLV